MKIKLETIHYTKSQSSFHFFKRKEAYFKSYRHYHPELELTYIEEGNGIRYIGDNISSFEAGDLVLIGANLPHDYVSYASEDNPFSAAYVLQFPGSFIQNIVEGKVLLEWFSKARKGIYFSNPNPNVIERIKSISSSPSFDNFLTFLSILNELRNHPQQRSISSIAFSNKSDSQKSQHKISMVTTYISEHFQQPINIKEMASLSNLTAPSFCRWFKQSTGSSFVTYLNATRVEKACQLLLQTEDNIAAIGFQTGFETISHFNRTFKKIKGVTPKAYRKNLVRLN